MFGFPRNRPKQPDPEPKTAAPSDAASIYLGRYPKHPEHSEGRELMYAGERHLLLFGPNGAGKGTRLLVPNLLRVRNRSLVVIDPKGELTSITAAYRYTVGQVVDPQSLRPARYPERRVQSPGRPRSRRADLRR